MSEREQPRKIALKYKQYLLNPEWSVDRSDSELLTLAEIVQNGKNKKQRWEQFEKSSLYREGIDTKTHFNREIEPCVRTYLESLQGDEIDANSIRWSIGIGKDEYYWTPGLFDSSIAMHIGHSDGSFGSFSKYAQHKEAESLNVPSYEAAGTVFSIFLYGIFLSPFVAFALWVNGVFDPSPEEIRQEPRSETNRIRQEMDSCKASLTSSITESCESDPVFSYCSLNYESHEILGSGCAGRVKRSGSYLDQVEFCKNESLESVGQTCAIELYGCIAATGRDDC